MLFCVGVVKPLLVAIALILLAIKAYKKIPKQKDEKNVNPGRENTPHNFTRIEPPTYAHRPQLLGWGLFVVQLEAFLQDPCWQDVDFRFLIC